MKYRRLGSSGLKVSELCLGTMTFGSDFFNIAEVDQDLATRMVERALEAGVNFFDTANIYSYGQSERILGNALEDIGVDRKDVVVATKVRGAMSEEAAEGTGDVNNVGLSRKHIFESCHASLERLGLDCIDLYQVHGWDPDAPIEETLAALNDLVRSGYVRYIGCSNWSARHLMKALGICRKNNWACFESLQAYYSLANRDLEHELLPLCNEEGLGVMPWSPLSGGFLTGKYGRGSSTPDNARRVDFDFPPVKEEQGYEAIEQMRDISERTGASLPQIALRWLSDREGVSSVIVGARNMEQLDDNLGAAEIELSREDTSTLNEITHPPVHYPEWMYAKMANEELSEHVE
jgi:aryl-alcohol dehydrogenase-like predicted oxidoreductase